MATGETRRVSGKWVVVPLVVVMAVTVAGFLFVQLSGRGAKARNYLVLSYTAGLRDVEQGYYLDAVKSLTPVVEAGGQPAAIGFRGEAYLRMKKYAEAEKDFRRAVEVEPNLPANHAGLGAALAGQERHEEAIAQYDAALGLFGKAEPTGRVRRTGDTPDEVRTLRAASAEAMERNGSRSR